MKPILPFIHQDDPRGLRGPKTWENHHNYEPHPMYPYEDPLESIQNERWRETSPTWFARTIIEAASAHLWPATPYATHETVLEVLA
jgi:hypothetical protein